MGDLIILWEYRERAPLLTRYWLKLWAKRIWTGPALLGILFRRAKLRLRGATVGSLSVISPANIDGKMELLQIGKASFIGRVHIALHASVTIGNFAVISDSATLLTGSHSLSDPDWGLVALPIEVGSYAWIGQGATVLPGVVIGTGAVVGACAVVSQSVEAFTVVAGNPARAVGTKRESDLRYVPICKVAAFGAWLGDRSNLANDISRS